MNKSARQKFIDGKILTQYIFSPGFGSMRSPMASSESKESSPPLDLEDLFTATAEELKERKSLVLWRRPVTTLKYGSLEAGQLLLSFAMKLLNRWLLGSLLFLTILYFLPGPHESLVRFCEKNMAFSIYWLGLGVLSSVGFGTGLHTFLLYLGPHIASVTLAAYECQTLDFPTPPYPDKKICPPVPYTHTLPNVWSILSKVRPEAFLWGLGTALGELPPYFMARSARLSGQELEDEEEVEVSGSKNFLDGAKVFMERVVRRIGFMGILLCASVPNPLFDLAGITCGHFLVPFWKFFGATIIGKALVKATFQQLFVIVAFSEDLVNKLVTGLGGLPWIGPPIQGIIKDVLKSTKQQMHSPNKSDVVLSFSLVVRAFELCAFLMVAAFVVSLINSLAQINFKRRQDKERSMRNLELLLYADNLATEAMTV
ncbi:uncharacterized protein Dana_GF25286 [Drosophila ananassae]|uniref:Vacuole membrane protein 1 n=2 Tax=Drosophila ananassae TaxID=7217 RepID=B3M4B8_DROAN|nr:uncharacterized protein Dana_GF25286 [Drosophila ananassae]